MICLSEAFYFPYQKNATYQRTNHKRQIKKTNFNNKKHGGTIFANSTNLPHQPTPSPLTFQTQIDIKKTHFLSLTTIKKLQQKHKINRF